MEIVSIISIHLSIYPSIYLCYTSIFHKGFRLGETEGPSDSVTGATIPKKQEKILKTLTFWKDGFTVDDGPLRDGQSSEDQRFLQDISRG